MSIEERLDAIENRLKELEEKVTGTVQQDEEFYESLNNLANASIEDVLKFYRGA